MGRASSRDPTSAPCPRCWVSREERSTQPTAPDLSLPQRQRDHCDDTESRRLRKRAGAETQILQQSSHGPLLEWLTSSTRFKFQFQRSRSRNRYWRRAAQSWPGYHRVRTAPLLRIGRSEVMRVRSWRRAVAAMRRSAGSGGKAPPSCSDSIATSTVSGSTSRWGDAAAVRNHSGHGPKPSSTTTRPRASCQAASFNEIAAIPTRSCRGTAPKAARARRLRRGWSSTDQSHACVSSTYFTCDVGTNGWVTRSATRCHPGPPRYRPESRPGLRRHRSWW